MKTRTFQPIIALLLLLISGSSSQDHRSFTVRCSTGTAIDAEMLHEMMPDFTIRSIDGGVLEGTVKPRGLYDLMAAGMPVTVLSSPRSEVIPSRHFKISTGSADPIIQIILNGVSAESIRTNILALQNFGTRYEYTWQQDSAGVYIYNQFVQLGLQTEYDNYAFGTTNIYGLHSADASNGWLVGTKGMIAATTDGGESWLYNNSTLTSDLFAVNAWNADTLWTAGASGKILKSTDRGTIWISQTSGVSNSLYGIVVFSKDRVVTVGTSGRILRTTNGGLNWASMTSPSVQTYRAIDAPDSVHAWAVGAAATIIYSSDAGASWVKQNAPPGVGNYLRAVDFIDSSIGWAVGEGRTILKTTDAGSTWIKKTAPAGIDTVLRGVSFIDALKGWIVDYDGRILATTDGGETWTIQYEHLGWRAGLLNLLASNSGITVCGMYGNLYLSTDLGASWTRKTASLPSQHIHMSKNIVATIPGTVTPENECIIVAHYDSYSNNPNVSAPGANDNATGTCAVLEAARLCAGREFESTIRFVAVSGEELGMYGSDHYAFRAREEGRTIIGVVNGDMIGYPTTLDTARLVIGSYETYNRLIDSAIAYNARYGIGLTLVPVIDFTGASDYGPFALAGYDALDVAEGTAEEIWGGADPYYHTTSDTEDKLNPAMYRRGTKLMIAVLTELARPYVNTVSLSFKVHEHWNLVSIPVIPPDTARSQLFPTSLPPAFGFSGEYHSTEYLECGNGYWLKFPDTATITMTGVPQAAMTIPVTEGWNLVGSVIGDILVETVVASPPDLIASHWFSYNHGYLTTDTLSTGQGYWVKIRGTGDLTLSSPTGKSSASGHLPRTVFRDPGYLTFTDHSGNRQVLLYDFQDAEGIDLSMSEMPPAPPSGIFDVRFTTNRFAALSTGTSSTIHAISVSSANYPYTVEWRPAGGNKQAILTIDSKEHHLLVKGSAVVSSPAARISLTLGGPPSVPRKFGLSQNVPNPFNPGTLIHYDVPVRELASIRIYDVLGRLMATILDEIRDPGSYRIYWDASGLPSGTYYCRFTGGGEIITRKLILLR